LAGGLGGFVAAAAEAASGEPQQFPMAASYPNGASSTRASRLRFFDRAAARARCALTSIAGGDVTWTSR
jgi:hypothetical protein